MKKMMFMAVSILLMTVAANAQNAAKARQILDKTAANVSAKGGASANFKITSEKTTTQGTIAIKENKFRVTSPEALVWFDGHTQWMYMQSTEEVNISTPTEAQQARMNPYQFINLYKKGYSMSTKTVGGNHEVHLVAVDLSKPIQEVFITVNSKTYLPSHIKMRQSGKWFDITVSNFKAAAQSDASFKFNAKDYPHAEVIDLR